MFFFGFISLLQCWFLPGLTFLIFIKRIKFSEIILLSLPLSLVINYLLVLILSLLNIYTRKFILLIILLEIIIVFYKFYKINFYKKSKIFINYFVSFNKLKYNLNLSILDFFIIILFILYFFLALVNIGEVVHPSDPLIMWNEWALQWFRGNIPMGSGDYPQSIPISLSIIYLLIQSTEVEFFSRIFFLIYPLWVFFIFIQSTYLLKKYEVEIKLSLIFFSLFNFYIFRHYAMYIGYVDPVLIVFSGISAFILLKLVKEKLYEFNYIFIIFFVIISGSGIVKQTGLSISFVSPFLFFIFLKENFQKKFIYSFISFLITLLIVSPWYLYKLYYYFILNLDQSNIPYLLNQVSGTLLSKIFRGVYYLFNWTFPFILLLIIYALKNRYLLIIFISFIFPVFLIWSIFFGIDNRNFAVAIPILSLFLGFGYFNFIKNLNKFFLFNSHFKLILLSILLIISIFFINILRSNNILIAKSIEKKMLRGNSKINSILYHYIRVNNVVENIYYNDQDFYKLPKIENQLILENCEAIMKRVKDTDYNKKFYVFINKNLCLNDNFQELDFFIDKKKIFSEENFSLYLILK